MHIPSFCVGLVALSVGVLSVPSAWSLGPAAEPGTSRSAFDWESVRNLPIQNGGRLKPLDSFARESVLHITGSRSLRGWDPIDLVFSWIAFPDAWSHREFIEVKHPELRKQLLLDSNRVRFSPQELLNHPVVLQYGQSLSGRTQTSPGNITRGNPQQNELSKLFSRLRLYLAVVSGEAWTVLPAAEQGSWKSLGSVTKETMPETYAALIKAYYQGDADAFQEVSQRALGEVRVGLSQKEVRLLHAEVFYHEFRPFLWAWILYLLAALLWILSSTLPKCVPFAWAATIAGFLIHLFGFALRIWIAGRPPVSNMYESVIWVSFGILLFAFVLQRKNQNKLIMAVACTLAGFCLISGEAAPAIMDPSLHPLVPVLRSNFWLTIHVLTITLSYAAFALSMGLGDVSLFHLLLKRPGWVARVESTNQLMYRAMQIGVVLVAGGTILGGVWADYSWGRFWGWDPKEVWALITLLVYLTILHGRYAGWVGTKAFAACTVVAFLSVVMAWYGVNFVLGVGLHSYGFASGGQWVVGGFCLIQLAYVGLVLLRGRKQK